MLLILLWAGIQSLASPGARATLPPLCPATVCKRSWGSGDGCRVSACLLPPGGMGRGGMEDTVLHRAGGPSRGTRRVVPSDLSSRAGSTQSPGCHAGQKCLCTPLNRALPAKLPPPRSPTCPLAGRKTTEVDVAGRGSRRRRGSSRQPRAAAAEAAASIPPPTPGSSRARAHSRLRLERLLLSLGYLQSIRVSPHHQDPQP